MQEANLNLEASLEVINSKTDNYQVMCTVAPPHGPIVEKRVLKCPPGSQNMC